MIGREEGGVGRQGFKVREQEILLLFHLRDVVDLDLDSSSTEASDAFAEEEGEVVHSFWPILSLQIR